MLCIPKSGPGHHFDIVFNNYYGYYEPGQQITGKLQINILKPLKIEKILVQFKGKALVKFRGEERKYQGIPEYYFYQIRDTQFVQSFGESLIPIGNHEIPISFSLPQRLPSSYESYYGYIRYSCTAKFVRKLARDIKIRRMFKVRAWVDLNEINFNVGPVNMEKSARAFRLCCCLTGKFNMKLIILKRGFVPGERVSMTFHISNNSSKTLKTISAQLQLSVLYIKRSPCFDLENTRKVSIDISKVKLNCVIKPEQTEHLTDHSMEIPHVPPSIAGCSVMERSYYIKIYVDRIKMFSIPIMIGDVPLKDIGSYDGETQDWDYLTFPSSW